MSPEDEITGSGTRISPLLHLWRVCPLSALYRLLRFFPYRQRQPPGFIAPPGGLSGNPARDPGGRADAGGLGLLLSSRIRQLENFAGVMNFVIFPVFFLSSALYPLWKMREASPRLADLCALNPFTQAVELIRFAAYGQANLPALGWTLLATGVFTLLGLRGYDPAKGMARRVRLTAPVRPLGRRTTQASLPSLHPKARRTDMRALAICLAVIALPAQAETDADAYGTLNPKNYRSTAC